MATIRIDNAGSSLKITTNGTDIRNILKSSIKEVSVIKTNIIKIDIGAGALNNIFLPFADVIQPVCPSPEDLKDVIIADYLTENTVLQAQQLSKLSSIENIMEKIKEDVDLFTEPLIYDDTNPYVIYKGYALPSSSVANPVWAIKRITQTPLQVVTEWADGDKQFDNVWNNHLSLVYL